MITRKVRVDGNKVCPGKRIEATCPVVQVVGQLVWGGQAVKWKFSQFDNFNSMNSNAYLSCLNRFMVLIAQ